MFDAFPIAVGVGATRVGKAVDAVGDCAFTRLVAKMIHEIARNKCITVKSLFFKEHNGKSQGTVA